MRKKFLFFSLAALAAFNFMSCDDEDENNNGDNTTNNGGGTTTSNLSAEFVGASDCQGSPFDDETRAGDQSNGTRIVYKYDSSKGEMALNLENAVMNCAALPKMVVTFSGDTIIFTPYDADTSEIKADCVCLYNLTSKVKGVESKVYYIRPSYLRNEEDIKVLELTQKEEGVVSFSWNAF
ncbi:MAG: hypothetical protein IKQ08_05205 [Paludibacteraceae bacterium]|nr:hypothetical protein [Paludibacteraceae bacterium]